MYKKKWAFVVLMVIFGSAFLLIYLIINGNSNQIYNDIIVEYTSMFSSNKAAERTLIFILCFGGIAVYSIYFLINKSKSVSSVNMHEEGLLINQKGKEFLCALISMIIVYLLVFGGMYPIVVASLIFASVLYIIDKELILPGICVFFMSIYTYIALYRVYVCIGGQHTGNNLMAVLVALILCMIPLTFSNKHVAILRLCLIEGAIIPFSLLIYTANKYKSGEDIIRIDVSNAMVIVIGFIIAIFVIDAVVLIIRRWNSVNSMEDVIRMGTCITIMAFNRFDGTGAIMPTDLHHPFENIIGYSQVTQLGRVPFKNYIPVSGMYSIIQGAIFDWFGQGGTLGNYYVTNNLFYLFVIIAIVWLLNKHVDRTYVFLISLVFFVQSYNRVVFVLPIMLLLAWKKLIKKRNLWLVFYFLTSLFQGLYYPLYGVATCIAFFPMAIYQIVTYVKSGDLRKDIKTIRFWIGWIGCLGLAGLNIYFLVGTLKHMLAMSGQSILADGISRFGQLVPSWFFSYLGDTYPIIRLSLYYIFTFIIPPLFVWVVYALAIGCAQISIEDKKLKIRDMRNGCILISLVIVPIVCYTFTVIRYDIDSIYARSSSILFMGAVILLIFTWNYIRDGKVRLILTLFSVAIPAVVNTVGVFATESNSKLQAYYTVPENYIYVSGDIVEKLGTGFMEQNIYDLIQTENVKFQNKDKTQSYWGDPAWFGYYYLLNIKGDGSMEMGTVKSYSAAQEFVKIVRENNSIVGASFMPSNNYYLYHWLMASGEYYWDADLGEFIPNNGKYTRGEILEKHRNVEIVSETMNLGKTPSSWGLSMDSLEKLFTEVNVTCSIKKDGNSAVVDFGQAFDGDAADFVYIEFSNMNNSYNYILYNLNEEIEQVEHKYSNLLMRKNYNPGMAVQVLWQDNNGEDHAMICNMSQGKLLLPLGAGAKWLFNNHNSISIRTFQDDIEIQIPEISKVRFLKIQEIQ